MVTGFVPVYQSRCVDCGAESEPIYDESGKLANHQLVSLAVEWFTRHKVYAQGGKHSNIISLRNYRA